MPDAVKQVGQNCFVFRTSSDRFVQEELQQGRLRQGWSPPGTSLLNSKGQERSKEEWTRAYKRAWEENPSPRRHGILRRMLDMRVDDVVLCPKAPTYGKFTIAEVSECYRFAVAAGHDDFGHIIALKNQREVSNAYNADAVTISDLFKSFYFRSPVTKVQKDKRQDVLGAVRGLQAQGDTSTSQDRDEIREELYQEGRTVAAKSLMKHVAKWGFDQFEAAVGKAFQRKGYEQLARKSARGGGDADHVYSMPMPGFEDMDNIPLLIVQVKHHLHGATDVQGVRQLLQWKPGRDMNSKVRCKVLFSSSSSFTDKCRHLAEAHDVLLIGGTEAGLFML